MKKTAKYTVLFAVLIMTLCLFACGDSGDGNPFVPGGDGTGGDDSTEITFDSVFRTDDLDVSKVSAIYTGTYNNETYAFMLFGDTNNTFAITCKGSPNRGVWKGTYSKVSGDFSNGNFYIYVSYGWSTSTSAWVATSTTGRAALKIENGAFSFPNPDQSRVSYTKKTVKASDGDGSSESAAHELKYNTWATGTIVSSENPIWCKFYATKDTAYTIIWEDYGNGISGGDYYQRSDAADIRVYAYSASQEYWSGVGIDNGWLSGTGNTLAATATEYVYLKITLYTTDTSSSNYRTGKFRIGYVLKDDSSSGSMNDVDKTDSSGSGSGSSSSTQTSTDNGTWEEALAAFGYSTEPSEIYVAQSLVQTYNGSPFDPSIDNKPSYWKLGIVTRKRSKTDEDMGEYVLYKKLYDGSAWAIRYIYYETLSTKTYKLYGGDIWRKQSGLSTSYNTHHTVTVNSEGQITVVEFGISD